MLQTYLPQEHKDMFVEIVPALLRTCLLPSPDIAVTPDSPLMLGWKRAACTRMCHKIVIGLEWKKSYIESF